MIIIDLDALKALKTGFEDRLFTYSHTMHLRGGCSDY